MCPSLPPSITVSSTCTNSPHSNLFKSVVLPTFSSPRINSLQVSSLSAISNVNCVARDNHEIVQ